MGIDNREDFNDTWLFESPEGIAPSEFTKTITYMISEKIKLGATVVDLGNNYKKIEGKQVLYYWYEKDGIILLGVEFNVAPHALVVGLIGKKIKGQPPWASDLYNVVLQDRKDNPGELSAIRISSDKQLTGEGLDIWKRLLAQGHKISIYDRNNPGQSFVSVTSEEELLKYFKHGDRHFQQYQYIISESKSEWEVRALFDLRRYRELSGLSLN